MKQTPTHKYYCGDPQWHGINTVKMHLIYKLLG